MMTEQSIPLWKLTMILPAALEKEQAVSYAGLYEPLEAMANTIVRQNHDNHNPWTLEWIFDAPPDQNRIDIMVETAAAALPDIAPLGWDISEVPQHNWLEYSYKQFAPFSVGGFFIYGSHFDGSVPSGQIGLQIDAATAFGSGEHGTTAGCLEALHDLHDEGFTPRISLDMGTGSGILAIAAHKLWNTPVIAPDNDEEAVIVAARHRDLNNIPQHAMICLQSEGFVDTEIKAKGPYPLIIANILAITLREMADDLSAALAPGGYTILSGILEEQAESVIKRYAECGLTLKSQKQIGEWSTLMLQKPAA